MYSMYEENVLNASQNIESKSKNEMKYVYKKRQEDVQKNQILLKMKKKKIIKICTSFWRLEVPSEGFSRVDSF